MISVRKKDFHCICGWSGNLEDVCYGYPYAGIKEMRNYRCPRCDGNLGPYWISI